MTGYTHIDAACARCGARIVDGPGDRDKLQTQVRNALGVLREDGVFALYLYLQYRFKEGGEVIWKEIKDLWCDPSFGPLLGGQGADREQVIALTESLDALLLARKVAERALVYALYGLRAGEGPT